MEVVSAIGVNDVTTSLTHSKLLKEEKDIKSDNKEDSIERSYFNKELNYFGCKHYARNCFIKAECCQEFFVCRLCHDEYFDKLNDNSLLTTHVINRYKTQTIKCMNCGMIQPISQYCINPQCSNIDNQTKNENENKDKNKKESKNESKSNDSNNNDNNNEEKYMFGEYYCKECKFFDNISNYDKSEKKEIYHCEKCNICRIGKKEDFTHCLKCDACIHNDIYVDHHCIEKSLHSNCPLCMGYLFTSTKPVTFWNHCGHAIHQKCLNRCINNDIRCPLCRTPYWTKEELLNQLRQQQQQQQQQSQSQSQSESHPEEQMNE